MAIIDKREDFMSRIGTMLGERNDDEALNFMSDMSDTFDSFSKKEVIDVDKINSDWQTKYNALDNEWRNKYKDRFMNKPLEENDEPIYPNNPDDNDKNNPSNFEDLFN